MTRREKWGWVIANLAVWGAALALGASCAGGCESIISLR